MPGFEFLRRIACVSILEAGWDLAETQESPSLRRLLPRSFWLILGITEESVTETRAASVPRLLQGGGWDFWLALVLLAPVSLPALQQDACNKKAALRGPPHRDGSRD